MIVNLLRVHTLYLSSVVVLLYVNYVLYYCQHPVNINYFVIKVMCCYSDQCVN